MALDCRFYKNMLPTTEDVVVVKIGSENEYGYKVSLLEYSSIEGFVNLSELVQGRFKKRSVKEGDVVAMTVLRVDKDKNHIDLSKRKVSLELGEETLEKYKYSTYLHKIGKEIYTMYKNFPQEQTEEQTDEQTDEHDLEFIMDITIWKLYNTYTDEPHDKIYNNILKDPTILFVDSELSQVFVNKAVENINSRVTKDNMIKEIDIHLLVTDKEGVNLIKKILTSNTVINPDYKVSVLVNSPPIYTVRVEGPDAQEGLNVLTSVIENIRQLAKQNNAEFDITSDYKTVKESKMEFVFLTDYELGVGNL